MSNSFCVLASNTFEISSIPTLSLWNSLVRDVGIHARNGKTSPKRKSPLSRALRAVPVEDAPNVSKTSVM